MAAEPATLTIGEPGVEVRLHRSARARRLTLRIAAGTGEARVTAPPRVPLAQIHDFLAAQADWLHDRIAQLPQTVTVEPGATLPLRGVPMRLEPARDTRVTAYPDRLAVPDGPGFAARLRGWLKAQARADLAAACDRHAARLDVAPARLTLRDTRSRWGSCTAEGALMFSWRLILAPAAVLDYVALHEVAHLREMNHSARYWALVERAMPDYRRHRGWLKRHGADLHRYRF